MCDHVQLAHNQQAAAFFLIIYISTDFCPVQIVLCLQFDALLSYGSRRTYADPYSKEEYLKLADSRSLDNHVMGAPIPYSGAQVNDRSSF